MDRWLTTGPYYLRGGKRIFTPKLTNNMLLENKLIELKKLKAEIIAIAYSDIYPDGYVPVKESTCKHL